MPRATVLVSYPGDHRVAARVLDEIRTSSSFVRDTYAFIEGFHYVFGAADFAVTIYVAAWGNVGLAIRKLLEQLNNTLGTGVEYRVRTSTILGADGTLVNDPKVDTDGMIAEMLAASERVNNITGHAFSSAVASRTVAELYLKEKVREISELAELCKQLCADDAQQSRHVLIVQHLAQEIEKKKAERP